MRRTTIRTLVPALGATLGVLILAAVGALTMQRAHELEGARDLIERTYEIREEMQVILSRLTEAETAQRGFLLTGDARDLEPYGRAVQELPRCFATLRRLMAGSPDRQPQLAQLETLARRKIDEMERAIAARRRSAEDALAVVRTGEGRRVMDEMRQAIDEMFGRETRTLRARVASADARFREVQVLTAAGTLVAIALLLTALVAIARAVRAREKARSQTQLETVTGNATSALFLTDARQHCTYMNPAAEAMTGYRLAELQGRPLHDVIHHTRPDGRPYPRAECPVDRALPQTDRQAGEQFFVRKDGTFYPVAYTASPIRGEGETTGTVLEVRDITAEKRAGEERAALLERERAADEFLAILSHELRTPLNAVLRITAPGTVRGASPPPFVAVGLWPGGRVPTRPGPTARRTLHQNDAPRMGVRRSLPDVRPAHPRPPGFSASLQLAPPARRTRRSATDQQSRPPGRSLETSHLAPG